MQVLYVKLQVFLFIFLLNITAFHHDFSKTLEKSQKNLKNYRNLEFLFDFLEFQEYFQEDYIKDLLETVDSLSLDTEGRLESYQQNYEEKSKYYENSIEFLKNQMEVLEYELKVLSQSMYNNEDEITETTIEYNRLELARKQIVEMKINESELYHKKSNETYEFIIEYEQIFEIFEEIQKNIKLLLEGNIDATGLIEKKLMKIKNKKKKVKNRNLVNFLLLNEPFLIRAIHNDYKDQEVIERIMEGIEEMRTGLIGHYEGLKDEMERTDENYRNRIGMLYEEYENISVEIKFYEERMKICQIKKTKLYDEQDFKMVKYENFKELISSNENSLQVELVVSTKLIEALKKDLDDIMVIKKKLRLLET